MYVHASDKQIDKPVQQLYHADQIGAMSLVNVFLSRGGYMTCLDISTAAYHSRDHTATRRLSSAVAMQR